MKRTIAATAETGEFLSDKQTLCFKVHGFASMIDKFEIKTPALACHGHDGWCLKIYPTGNELARKKRDESGDDYIPFSVFLCCEQGPVRTVFSIHCGSISKTTTATYQIAKRGRGWPYFATRDKILDQVDKHGTLSVLVDIQTVVNTPPTWKPRKLLCSKLNRLFRTHQGADIEFTVQGSTFAAHKHVVGIQCPTLLEMVDSNNNKDGPVAVDANAAMFKVLLEFLYTEDISEEFDWKENGTELVGLADRFGCVDLKLFAEAKIVALGFEVDQAPALLLFADGHSCALLKEAALDKLVSNLAESFETEGWAELKTTPLLDEVLKHSVYRSGPDYKRVTELRHEISEAVGGAMGEDLDGSKQILVDRLRECRASNQE